MCINSGKEAQGVIPTGVKKVFSSSHAWAIIIFMAFFCVYFLSAPRDYKAITNSPLENLDYQFIRQQQLTGGLGVEIAPYKFDNFSAENPMYIFMPRDGALVDGRIVPQDSLGIFVLGPVLFGKILLFITPLLVVLCLALVYAIAWQLFHSKLTSISATILAGTLPPLWFQASRIVVPDVFSAFFLLALIFYVIKSREYPTHSNIGLAYIFGVISISYRYTNLLYVAPLLFFLLAWNFSYFLKWKKVIIYFFATILVLAPILILNQQLYGKILTTGYSYSYSTITSVTEVKTSLLLLNFDYVLEQLNRYFVILMPIFALGFVLALAGYRRLNMSGKLLLLYVVCMLAATSIFFGSKVIWGLGTDSPVIDSSFMRYLLPLYILMAIFVVYFLKNTRSYIFILASGTIVITNIISAMYNPGGIIPTYATIEKLRAVEEAVLIGTPENSVIAVTRSDKVLFPERRTVATGLFSSGTTQGKTSFWGLEPDSKKLASALSDLALQTPTYFIDEGIIDAPSLESELAKYKYKLTLVNQKILLYKVDKA